jgi:hypothetical protein
MKQDKKRKIMSSFLQGIASIYENLTRSNTKQYQQRIVQENLEREKTNKSQSINTSDTGDLYYRGSVHQDLIPVEESTKDVSFSTLSLSITVTKIGECSFFFVNKRLKSPQGQTTKIRGSC